MSNKVLVPLLYGPVGDGLREFGRRFGDVSLIDPTTVESVAVDGQTLLVADRLPQRKDVHVLLPQGADQLKIVDGRVVILVPFGSGESGIHAMRLAVQMAKLFQTQSLQVEILFYHTTWRIIGKDSENGWDHLCSAAHKVADELRGMAQHAELPFRYQIEVEASTVPGGIVACALRHHASLIVMARGGEVRLGSYVDQTADLSPVPLLIASKEVA